MSKLISNSFECGYCDIEKNFRDIHCKNPKKKESIICNTLEFPTNCPLQDGISEKQFIEHQIRLGKNIASHLVNVKPKRRNRRDCRSYNYLTARGCEARTRQFETQCTCRGVNCGYFKPK
jgi:hypothetical protein